MQDFEINKAIFASRLRTLRRERGMTQNNLAEIMKVKVPTVSAWENAVRTTTYAKTRKLADLFDVDVEFLTGVQPHRRITDYVDSVISENNGDENAIKNQLSPFPADAPDQLIEQYKRQSAGIEGVQREKLFATYFKDYYVNTRIRGQDLLLVRAYRDAKPNVRTAIALLLGIEYEV